MSKKEIVNRILTELRQKVKDRWMSKRFVLHILEQKMTFFLSQKLRDRTLYRESNLFSVINCYELEKIDTVSCDIIEFKTCDVVMKGKEKLPELIFSRYGSSVRYVATLDQSERIYPTTPTDFIRNKDRKSNHKPISFYIRDGYPYFVNTEIEAVFLEILTLDTKRAQEVGDNSNFNACESALSYDFIGSDKLQELVVQETIKEIMGSYIQIQPDENPDSNENSI
jgi:hypothetical protein